MTFYYLLEMILCHLLLEEIDLAVSPTSQVEKASPSCSLLEKIYVPWLEQPLAIAQCWLEESCPVSDSSLEARLVFCWGAPPCLGLLGLEIAVALGPVQI